MWAVGYVCHLSPGLVPSWLVALLMVAMFVAGGAVAGHTARGGWLAGLRAGALSAFLNLLVLGSLLSGAEPGAIVPSAAVWVPGSILAGACLGALGAGLGAARGGGGGAHGAGATVDAARAAVNWVGAFAKVGVGATALLVLAGGVVTGAEAGLAVVDWPNSYGYNMFLYPLSRMTGGIYFEHAHRLIGSLVGLTTLVFAVHLLRVESRRWVKGLGVAALVMVIVQGILGGLRVTGTFTMSSAPENVAPNLTLAVVHGVLGQVFFSTMVALAVFTSTTWHMSSGAVPRPSASVDRGLSALLIGFLVVQLTLGAVLRHTSSLLITHVTMAVLVTVLAMVVGMRVGGVKPAPPLLSSLGAKLLIGVGVQVVLGVGALIVTTMTKDVTPRPLVDIVVTTAHQANGAVLLALAVTIWLWTHRLLDATPAARTAARDVEDAPVTGAVR
jgi:cytochrome c oxidase assembly protein subunit 15